jgi:hypothetical protein
MKFYTIKIPVMVSDGNGDDVSRVLEIDITTSDQATPSDAVRLLAEKIREVAETVDIGDCT